MFSRRKGKEGYHSKEIKNLWKRLPKDTRVFMVHPPPEEKPLYEFIAKYQGISEDPNPIKQYIHKQIE